MKTALLLSLMTISFVSTANAGLFGTFDKYIIEKTGKVIEMGSNDVNETSGTYFDYRTHEKKIIARNEISKATKEEISGVKAGRMILLTTGVANDKTGAVISRYCSVFSLFENGMAHVGCRVYAEDSVNGQIAAERLDFIVNDIGSVHVTPEVLELEGLKKGDTATLYIKAAKNKIKAGSKVKVLAIFDNGEVLIQKRGFNILDTSSVINKLGVVDRVSISDLQEL